MFDKIKSKLKIARAHTERTFFRKSLFAVVSICAYVIVLSTLIFPASNTNAAIPKYINFQGKLTAVSDGSNVANGTYAFKFRLYNHPTAGSLLWTETFDQASGGCGKLTVTNGVFNAKLGSCGTPDLLSAIDFTGGSLYLTIEFDPGTGYDGEMSPRKQLVSSAYAFVANGVSGDGAVNTTNSSTTALTVANLGSGYGLQVDASTASADTGLKITSADAASGLALAVISSGTNENLTINAKGSGTISLGNSSTGNLILGGSTGDILLGGGSASTGCTVTNSTGAFACSAGGTFTTLGLTGAITGATGFNGLIVAANTGVITTGTWNGNAIPSQYGGTGINTSASTGVPSISSGTWSVNTQLPVSLGGTNISSYTIGDIIYASGATTLSKLADVATGSVMVSGGVGTAPAWSAAITVGTSVTSPTINATTALQLNGTSINTAGTLTNVAYLNQANTFTANQSITNATITNGSKLVALTGTATTSTSSGTGYGLHNTFTNANTTNPDTAYANYTTVADATALANTVYGDYNIIALSGNAAKTGVGQYATVTTSSTTADTIIGYDAATSATGIIGSGTRANYGARLQPASTSANTAGTQNTYGVYSTPSSTLAAGSTENVYGGYFKATGTVASGTVNSYGLYVANPSMNTTGTSAKYGLYVEDVTTSAADSNYAAVFAGGNVGIGTTAPVQKLVIGLNQSGANQGIPATSGSTQNGALRIAAGPGGIGFGEVMDFGINVSNSYGWIQVTNAGSLSSSYNLALNPNSGNVGVGDSTPAALFTVGSGDLFQVNSSGAIAAATGLTSSGTINFSGLTASSGVYTDGSKNLTSTVPASGTVGYWSRSGTTLSPATSGDSITTSGVISTTSGGITSTGTLNAINGFNLNNGAFTINGSSGSIALTGYGTTSLTSTTTTGNIITFANSSLAPGLSSNGYLTNLTFTNGSVNTSGTSTVAGINIAPTTTAAGAGGTMETYGIRIQNAAGTAGVGTQNIYGMRIGNQGAGTSTETTYGLYVDSQSGGATASYAGIFAGGNVGIGDTTPAALFTVGNTDLFQVNSSGAIAAATGVTSSGTITFSGLSAAGVVTNTSGGVLGTDTALDVATGGTNISSYTIGDIIYASGATTLSKLADVATGSVMVSGGVGTAPAWSAAITVGTSVTSPTINATTALQLNGTSINTAGTLTNVAYLNQANTFTANNIFQPTATTGNGLDVSSTSLTSGNLVKLTSTSTAAASNTQTVFNIATSGTNATSGQTTYGAQISNTHAHATAATNIGLYLNTSGAPTSGTSTPVNYALKVNAGVVEFAGDTRYGVSKSWGSADTFGMEQVSNAQSGYGAATRLFTSNVGSAVIALGKYTNTTVGSEAFTTWMLINASGNVGINSTGPDRKLDVLDASNPQLRLTQADGSVYTDLQTNSSGYLVISPSASRVGIGTTTPAEMLSVGTGSASNFNVNTSGDIYSAFTTLDGSSTASGAGTNSTTLIVASGTNFDVGNYVKVDPTGANVCSGVVTVCYSKITAKATNTLTISPALTWDNGASVVEMHVPELGGTDTASTLTNRYGRGYFIDGIVTGNGSTYFTDNSIKQTIAGSTFNFGDSNTSDVVFDSGTTVSINGPMNIGNTIQLGGGAAYIQSGDGLFQGGLGYVGGPTFSFTSSTDSGMYLDNSSGNRVAFSVDGVDIMKMTYGGGRPHAYIPNGFLCIDYGSTECDDYRGDPGYGYAKGFFTDGVDLAEKYPSTDSTLLPGEVVMVDDQSIDYIKRSNITAGQKVIGVVSTDPGLILGYKPKYGDDRMYPVALAGRVPVKVSNENGVIKPGDFLTASTTIPGAAMRASKAGPVIGQALEGYIGNTESGIRGPVVSTGSISVFIKPTNFNGLAVEEQMEGVIFDYNDPVLTVQTSIQVLENLLAQLPNLDGSNLSEINTDVVVAGAEVVTPNVTTHNLRTDTLSAATADGSLSVSSAAIFNGGLLVDSIGSVGDLLSFQGDVEFFGTPYFTKDTAGFAVVKTGVQSVDVIFEREYLAQPIVNASISLEQDVDQSGLDEDARNILRDTAIADAQAFLSDSISYVITNKSKFGFTIVLSKPATRDIKLSWTALAVRNATTFMSLELPSIPEAVTNSDSGNVAGDSTGNESGADSGNGNSLDAPPDSTPPPNTPPPPADSGTNL